MEKVISGTVRFQQSAFEARKALFAELANGQSPEVLLVTCADSRIDPNLVTQTQPGDLFICRNAGNIVPPHTRSAGGVTASIEYAIAILGVKDIVVCGHTDCGAMRGALQPDALEGLPHVLDWLEHTRAAVEVVAANHRLDDPEALRLVTEENVVLQLQHLRTHPAVAARITSQALSLHGWVYEIETGRVSCYDEEDHSFVPLEKRYASLLAAAAGRDGGDTA